MKFLKRIFLTAAFSLLVSSAAMAQSQNEIKVFINDSQIIFDQNPEIINSRTMVPMRAIFSSLGYDVYWDDSEKTVTAMKGNDIIQLTVGSEKAYKNGEEIILDSPAVIKNDRTLVPLRYVAESAMCNVDWNGEKQEVYIQADYDVYIQNNTAQGEEVDPLTLCDSVVEIVTNKMQGSGIIIGENGYIATNFHVMQGAESAVIYFNDSTAYYGEVKIAGYNIPADVVVIKIDKIGLKPVAVRDSSTVEENEPVTAIGSPGGALNTISTGTVNGFTSSIISTSAHIDHGSSGGALFDKNGMLIGMTSSFDTNDNFMAIPSNYISEISLTESIPLSKWKNVTPQLVPPEKVEVSTEGNKLKVYWSSVIGADGYYVYYSTSENGKYTKLFNIVTKKYLWYWSYPSCFTINNLDRDVYIKITTVMDGKESKSSEIYHVSAK